MTDEELKLWSLGVFVGMATMLVLFLLFKRCPVCDCNPVIWS